MSKHIELLTKRAKRAEKQRDLTLEKLAEQGELLAAAAHILRQFVGLGCNELTFDEQGWEYGELVGHAAEWCEKYGAPISSEERWLPCPGDCSNMALVSIGSVLHSGVCEECERLMLEAV